MTKLRFLDLFSGGGIYALGLKQAGHDVVGFCETDKECHKLLKKNWPTKPISWSIQLLNRALMASLAAGRAKITQSQINLEEVSLDPVQDSFGRWLKPFAWWDQKSSCWRTFQRHLTEGWAEYSGSWPLAGIISNGIAYQRQAQAHPTIAPGHTFLGTMPATEYKGTSRKRYVGSPNFRGGKASEWLRTCEEDPIYLNPWFAEILFGIEKGYTSLEIVTPHVLSEK